jgi:CheY-like chemotaxis protein
MVSTDTISILLVDDDPAYCEFLSINLAAYGYHVIVAHCGATALEFADQADVAVIDMIMPGLSGLETIPLVRCNNPNLKVIACSGCEEALFRADLDRLDVERFLPKPFPVELLVQAIDAALDLRALPTGR